MMDLFSTIGFRPFREIIYQNQTERNMMDLMSEFASIDHSDSCAAVCVIMSHGRLGQIYGTDACKDDGTVDITDMTDTLSRCRSLQGKPKIFFILSCQDCYGKSAWA